MADLGNRLRFYEPTGIGPAGPWDLLVNVRVTPRGYSAFPLPSALLPDAGTWLANSRTHIATWFRSGPYPVFVTLQSVDDADLPTAWKAQLRVVDQYGTQVLNAVLADDWALTGKPFCELGIPWQAGLPWTFTEAHGRLFMSTLGRTFVLSWGNEPFSQSRPVGQTRVPTGVASEDGLQLNEVSWRQGIGITAWPYVTGQFGGGIMCQHLDRVFYAGLPQGTQLRMTRVITDNERVMMAAWGLGAATDQTIITIGGRTMVWSDPTDPFAISLANFREVLCRGPITAMVSWNGKMFIFTDAETWVLEGNREEEFVLRRVSDGLGTQHQHSVVATPFGVMFGTTTGIYATDGQSVQKISEAVEHLWQDAIPDTKRTLDPAGWWAIAERSGLMRLRTDWGRFAWNEAVGELWAPIRTEGSLDRYGAALVFNTQYKAWSVWTPPTGTAGTPARPTTLHSIEWLCSWRNQTAWVGRYDGVVMRWMDDGSANTPYAQAYSGYRDQDALFVSRPLLMNPGRRWRVKGVELAWEGGIVGEAIMLGMEALPGALGSALGSEGDIAQWRLVQPDWLKRYQPGWDATNITWNSDGPTFVNRTVQKQYLECESQTQVARLYVLLTPGDWRLLGVDIAFEGGYDNPRG